MWVESFPGLEVGLVLLIIAVSLQITEGLLVRPKLRFVIVGLIVVAQALSVPNLNQLAGKISLVLGGIWAFFNLLFYFRPTILHETYYQIRKKLEGD